MAITNTGPINTPMRQAFLNNNAGNIVGIGGPNPTPSNPLPATSPTGTAQAKAPTGPKTSMYKATITCNDRNALHVDGLWLPEGFIQGTTATYARPFNLNLAGRGVTTAMEAFGISPQFQFMSTRVWTGSEMHDMSLTFFVYADFKPADITVLQPYRDLLALVLPKMDGTTGLLKSPGPHLALKDKEFWSKGPGATADAVKADAAPVLQSATSEDGALAKVQKIREGGVAALKAIWTLENQVSMTIGKYIVLPSIVITGVTAAFTHQMDAEGKPFCAEITVTFGMFQSPVYSDIEAMFGASETLPVTQQANPVPKANDARATQAATGNPVV